MTTKRKLRVRLLRFAVKAPGTCLVMLTVVAFGLVTLAGFGLRWLGYGLAVAIASRLHSLGSWVRRARKVSW